LLKPKNQPPPANSERLWRHHAILREPGYPVVRQLWNVG
jgi:hypothetical protein